MGDAVVTRAYIFIFLFVWTFQLEAAEICGELFLSPAEAEWQRYKQPNDRDLKEYNAVTGLNRRRARSLLKLIPRKGTIIDVGGGKGVAMQELALENDLTAVVINPQPWMESLNIAPNFKGKFLYIQGFAEKELSQFKNAADVITDIWGGFSYSPQKVKIIKLIFEALRPGGEAFVLFHPEKTPADVVYRYRTASGAIQKTYLPLDKYLARKFPEIFESYDSLGRNTYSARIIHIKKPQDMVTLPLKLKIKKIKMVKKQNNTLPKIELEAQDIEPDSLD